MQWLRNIVLFVAVAAGTVLAVARTIKTPGHVTAQQKEKPKGSAKRWAFRIAAILLVAGFGGFLVVASGIVPIKASSGHWPITAWILNFAMQRSVVMHSIGAETPRLDDRGLIVKGATHYDFGCRPCHGGPDLPQPVIAGKMTPHPPHLPPAIPKWQADELFYIVKHGVKFTGMPAWPAQQRDDEVWAMVAFLLQLPRLTAAEYYKIARSSTTASAPIENLTESNQTPRVVRENCSRCHAVDNGGDALGAFPILAGQRPNYIFASLLAFARGERHSGIMQPIAANLSAPDLRAIALYYSGLPRPAPSATAASTSAAERGKEIATRGIGSRRIPACSACHGPGSRSRNPIYPDLAGQHAEYLELQLELFKSNKRGGTPYAHIMSLIAGRLTAEQMQEVASYYAALAPQR